MTGKVYKKNIIVPMQDIDAAGIVFFAHLFRYAHETYETFMGAIGYPLHEYIKRGELIIPLRNAQADFRNPIRHGDALVIELIIKKLGDSSFTIEYNCTSDQAELYAQISTVHVMVSVASKTPVLIPPKLREALSAYS